MRPTSQLVHRHSEGFTLLEMATVVGIIAVLGIMIMPREGTLASILGRTRAQNVQANNLSIRDALQDFAGRNTANQGVLPSPYTGNGYTSTLYNSADVTTAGILLRSALKSTGLTLTDVNDDGTATSNVRVYQLVSGLTTVVPLLGTAGPTVTLTYQFGAIYLTECPKSTASCNPTAATGIPGTSTVMTSANYQTWTTSGTDGKPTFVSSFPAQTDMLVATRERMDKLRVKLDNYYRDRQITAIAGDTTNWYPTGATSLSGKTPGTNQGCRDGWYDLSTTTVLANAGIGAAEFGITAWKAPIEYCRDYDPTGTKGAGVFPHFAAIRIHQSVSSGIAPDSSVTGNNVVLTF